MKLTALTVAFAATLAFSQSAQARGHHRHVTRHEARGHVYARHHLARARYRYSRRHAYQYSNEEAYRNSTPGAFGYSTPEAFGYSTPGAYGYSTPVAHNYRTPAAHNYRTREARDYSVQSGHYGRGARPAAWCGWEMRQLVSADPGPSYNLARNWAHWGHAGPAGVGAVVVWSHHVGKIVGQEGGSWVIVSGNDGHRVRTRPRSIGGAIAIRWG